MSSDNAATGKPAPTRDRPWMMRTYSGHSTAKASNQLYRTNLAKGQTGLSIAFDLPTQTGYDPDDPHARGEVGKVGVPVAHLGHMATLLDQIPVGDDAVHGLVVGAGDRLRHVDRHGLGAGRGTEHAHGRDQGDQDEDQEPPVPASGPGRLRGRGAEGRMGRIGGGNVALRCLHG